MTGATGLVQLYIYYLENAKKRLAVMYNNRLKLPAGAKILVKESIQDLQEMIKMAQKLLEVQDEDERS